MANWKHEAILVHIEDDGRWLATLKRAPGVHARGATAAEAVADLAQLAADMDASDLETVRGAFDPYTPCGSWGCGCCSPHWNESALSGTYTELAGEVKTISVTLPAGFDARESVRKAGE